MSNTDHDNRHKVAVIGAERAAEAVSCLLEAEKLVEPFTIGTEMHLALANWPVEHLYWTKGNPFEPLLASDKLSGVLLLQAGSRPGLMIDLAIALRRDYTFRGRIVLGSVEPLSFLLERYPLFRFLDSPAIGKWNFEIVQYPQDFQGIAQVFERPISLNQETVYEFVDRYCGLKEHLAAAWDVIAHDVQKPNGKKLLQSAMFQRILLCTERFTAGVAEVPGFATLELFSQGQTKLDEEPVTRAVAEVQSRLEASVGNGPGRSLPTKALPGADLIVIGDDDNYDVCGLEAYGYRTIQAATPSEVRECLEQSPPIFLCDLGWNNNGQLGLELVGEALKQQIPIIILMSAGALPSDLPASVLRCERLANKRDATFIHRLIVERWMKIQRTENI